MKQIIQLSAFKKEIAEFPLESQELQEKEKEKEKDIIRKRIKGIVL